MTTTTPTIYLCPMWSAADAELVGFDPIRGTRHVYPLSLDVGCSIEGICTDGSLVFIFTTNLLARSLAPPPLVLNIFDTIGGMYLRPSTLSVPVPPSWTTWNWSLARYENGKASILMRDLEAEVYYRVSFNVEKMAWEDPIQLRVPKESTIVDITSRFVLLETPPSLSVYEREVVGDRFVASLSRCPCDVLSRQLGEYMMTVGIVEGREYCVTRTHRSNREVDRSIRIPVCGEVDLPDVAVIGGRHLLLFFDRDIYYRSEDGRSHVYYLVDTETMTLSVGRSGAEATPLRVVETGPTVVIETMDSPPCDSKDLLYHCESA
ncbi:MAG: hypothetical protein WC483_00505 [Candidatus Paceibacterota bacterium]